MATPKTKRYKATFAGGIVLERHSAAPYAVGWRVTGYGKHTGRKYEADGFSVSEERARTKAGYELDMMREGATLEIVPVEVIEHARRRGPIAREGSKPVITAEQKADALSKFLKSSLGYTHPTLPLAVVKADVLGGNPEKWACQLTVKGGKEQHYLVSRENVHLQRQRTGRVLMYKSPGGAAYAALEAVTDSSKWERRAARNARKTKE